MNKIIFEIIFGAIVALVLSLSLVNAVTPQELNEAKSLIDSKTDCKNLSGSQLEIIGEYLMEQMHPGEAHESMHEMMGLKEGSEAEEQFHISMAKMMYCGEGGMQEMMGMMMNGGMMSSNMMSSNTGENGMMSGMMNKGMMQGNMMNSQNTPTNWQNIWNIYNILYLVFIVSLIILICLFIIKLLGESPKTRK